MHFGTPVVPEEIQDVERMIERATARTRSGVRRVRDQRTRPTDDRARGSSIAGRRSTYGTTTTPTEAGQLRAISASRGEAVVRLAGVVVAVGGDEHRRLDLAEAIEHALDAEVRRARRPHRADRRGAERARRCVSGMFGT